MITVREQLNAVYVECGSPETAADRSVLENHAYEDALKRLDPEDQKEIRKLLNRLEARNVRALGYYSALELLAKVGMFYNGLEA